MTPFRSQSSFLSTLLRPLAGLNSLALAAAIVLIAAAAAGCSSHRKATATTVEREHQGAPGTPGSLVEIDEAFDLLTADYREWQTLKLPFSARVDGVKLTLAGNAYLTRDRQIYLSAKVLGMEMAVVSLTPDTLTIVDKYHRIYLEEPTSVITNIFPLTLGNLQDLLIGHCFIPGSDAAEGGKKMRREMELAPAESGGWTASPRLRGRLSALECAFFVGYYLESLDVKLGSHSMTALYGEPQLTTEDEQLGSFASSVEISIPVDDGKKTYGGNIRWNLRKATSAEAPRMKVPADCRKVTFAQLMKQIKEM